MIVPLDITPEIFAEATSYAEEMGKLNNSITEGQGNTSGFIGELLFVNYMKSLEIPCILNHTYDYDIVLDPQQPIYVDVKTKRTTVAPDPLYECSIADFNIKQKCDIYVFTRVDLLKNKGYILGWYPKKDYFEKARFLKKGQVDGSNNFVVKSDCYNMYIKDLYDFVNAPL